jgi:hypothetical protein
MRLAASTTVNFRSPSFTGTGSMKETGSLAGKLLGKPTPVFWNWVAAATDASGLSFLPHGKGSQPKEMVG